MSVAPWLLAVLALAAGAVRGQDATGGDLAALLDDAPSGFERALAPREFRFPEDHAAHPGFRTEWWYFTGNLATDGGRAFGFQLTFFRFALAPRAPRQDSAWATPQLWMAHFAVSDIDAGRYHFFERFSREGPGLAGARAPFAVWLDDWSARAAGPTAFPVDLEATAEGIALRLRLAAGKPLVLQGEQGLSRKSEQPGNASYYYSLTRMPARGVIEIAGERHAVGGTAWLDREWSSGALGEQQVGWDWFALQLDDGRDLMFYRLRRRDGSSDPASAGVLVAADGTSTPLGADDVVLDVLEWWTAPDGAARYPARVRLRVPARGIELEVTPRLADQEFRGRFRYYEGAVSALGSAGDETLTALGYLEMTGYAGAVGAR